MNHPWLSIARMEEPASTSIVISADQTRLTSKMATSATRRRRNLLPEFRRTTPELPDIRQPPGLSPQSLPHHPGPPPVLFPSQGLSPALLPPEPHQPGLLPAQLSPHHPGLWRYRQLMCQTSGSPQYWTAPGQVREKLSLSHLMPVSSVKMSSETRSRLGLMTTVSRLTQR